MSLYLASKSFFSVFVISLDFCEGKLFGFKMLSKFGFYALVLSAEEDQARGHLSPLGTVGTRDVERWILLIDKFSSKPGCDFFTLFSGLCQRLLQGRALVWNPST